MFKDKAFEIVNLLNVPLFIFVAVQLGKVLRAFVEHEKRHVLIASYIIQLCAKAGIRCKEDKV